MEKQQISAPVNLPRVTITYCTQCKWLLRAAYYAQELLSTFEASIGEVALRPSVGGTFTIYLDHCPSNGNKDQQSENVLIWDRKTEKGFPETKILKQRIRNVIEPDRNLGHSDTPSAKKTPSSGEHEGSSSVKTGPATDISSGVVSSQPDGSATCEDCK